MGKKAKKKARTPVSQKRVANHLQKTVPPQSVAKNKIANGHTIQNESKTCAHLERGLDLNALSAKIKSSESVKCVDCREGVADRRGNKGKGKQGKKKVGASTDSKSESKAIWVCLECGHYACGGVGFPTTAQSHAVRHARQTRHPLAIQLEKPSLRWCFPCSTLIPIEKIQENGEQKDDPLAEVVKLIKGQFTQAPSVDVEDAWFGSGSVTRDVNLTSSVPSSSDVRGGYVVRGMVNLGNTCFFNSVVQNLIALDRLNDYLGKLDTSIGPLTISLKKLFSEIKMENGMKNVIDPRSLFGSICSKAPQFRGYQQHDSHELLHCLLDVLSTEEFDMKKQSRFPQEGGVPHDQNVTFVDTVFGGQISSTICCVECGHSSTVYEPFLDLSLPVPTKRPPPKKNQPISRAKKAKILPKKGARIRPKVNKESESITSSVSSASASAQPTTLPIDTVVSSSDSMIETSIDSGAVADDRVISPPDHLTIKEHDNKPVYGKEIDKIAASTEEFTWLDYVDPGITGFDLHDANSMPVEASGNEDTVHDGWVADSQDMCTAKVDTLKELKSEKELEQHAVSVDDSEWLDYLNSQPLSSEINFSSHDDGCRQVHRDGIADVADHGSQPNHNFSDSVDEATDLKEEISSKNSWEDETPLQVKDSEVLLLPYGENTSTMSDVSREVVTSSMGFTQDESEFDGLGDMFNEPDVVYGPVVGPSLGCDNYQTNEVADSVLMAGNSSESDPGEVDHSDSPVSIESCLTHFTKEELLSSDNAWHCENCSRSLRQQQLESKKKKLASSCANGCETGSQIISADSISQSCSSNGSIENDDRSVDTNHKDIIPQNGKLDILSHVSSSDQGTGSCIGDKPSCTGPAMEKLQQVNPMLATKCKTETVDDEADSGAVKVKRDATKRVLIHKAPPILTIHLKRFSQDARGRLSKLSGHVIFRETIDLRPFMDTSDFKQSTPTERKEGGKPVKTKD